MLRLLLAGVLGGAATLVVTEGRFVYSARQFQIPFGTALKVTPDPANIWSWHNAVSGKGNLRFPIVVDLDGNGRNDTENTHWRVFVTDIQLAGDFRGSVWISDGISRRWKAVSDSASGTFSHHFSTPLMLPVGSTLNLEVVSTAQGFGFEAHLVGRVVTL